MRQFFNSYERLTTEDLNAISETLIKGLNDKLLYRLFGKLNGFLRDGFKPTYTSATSVTLTAGRGFLYIASPATGKPNYQAIESSTNRVAVIAAAHATLPRIDLIVAAPAEVNTTTESRDIKTGGTGAIVGTTVPKVKSADCTVTVVAGTPAGSPAAPAVPAGTVAIAEVYVSAVTGVANQSAITDRRIRFGSDLLEDLNTGIYALTSSGDIKIGATGALRPTVTGADLGTSTYRWDVYGAVGDFGSHVHTPVVDSPAGTTTLAIGGTNADNVTIGKIGGSVTILGSALYTTVTNTYITDKIVTLNRGGAASSAGGSGFEFEENSVITAYTRISADRLSYEIKVPASAGEIALTPGSGAFRQSIVSTATAARTLTIPDISGTALTEAGAQSVTNKDLDGGTASATNKWAVPKASTATLLALTRREGNILFNTDTKTPVIDDGTSLLPISTRLHNYFHNSNFRLSQRYGESGLVPNNGAAPFYFLDRWLVSFGTCTGTCLHDSSVVPNAQSSYSLRLYSNDMQPSTSAIRLSQRIPGDLAKQFQGKNVTIAFWMYCQGAPGLATTAAAGSYIRAVYNQTANTFTGTQEAVGTADFGTIVEGWKQYKATIYMPNTSASGYSAGNGIQIDFRIVRDATAALPEHYLWFSQAQLVEGHYLPPYAPYGFSHEADRLACLRYYQKSWDDSTGKTVASAGATPKGPISATVNTTTGSGVNAGRRESRSIGPTLGAGSANLEHFNGYMSYQTPTRAAGTPTIYSWFTGAAANVYNASSSADIGAVVSHPGTRGFNVTLSAAASASTLNLWHWEVDAEL